MGSQKLLPGRYLSAFMLVSPGVVAERSRSSCISATKICSLRHSLHAMRRSCHVARTRIDVRGCFFIPLSSSPCPSAVLSPLFQALPNTAPPPRVLRRKVYHSSTSNILPAPAAAATTAVPTPQTPSARSAVSRPANPPP
ncbi:hypothetical protein R3P38DRAFT_1741362 [Favolaschia claudopus]|uniref:Uncharacterized protein n=1 Tax=Favolaschia claudopus TaxID=2862362 RepID=A0AAW0DG38_9AGAR